MLTGDEQHNQLRDVVIHGTFCPVFRFVDHYFGVMLEAWFYNCRYAGIQMELSLGRWSLYAILKFWLYMRALGDSPIFMKVNNGKTVSIFPLFTLVYEH